MSLDNKTTQIQVAKGFEALIANPKTKDRLRGSLLAGSQETPERILGIAKSMYMSTPALWNCDPNSVVLSVIKATELSLSLDPVLGEAYLVPYFSKHFGCKVAQMQVGYRGFEKLAFNSGKVTGIWAEVIRQNDIFDFDEGTERKLTHKFSLLDEERRGEWIGVYACLKYVSGFVDFELLSPTDVNRLKEHSKAKDKPDSPWNTDDKIWMWKKSAIRQLLKRAPLSVSVQRMARKDEQIDLETVPQAEIAEYIDAVALPEVSSEDREMIEEAEKLLKEQGKTRGQIDDTLGEFHGRIKELLERLRKESGNHGATQTEFSESVAPDYPNPFDQSDGAPTAGKGKSGGRK